ncbi:MAG: GrpB family protein [Enterococcus sp.]|uniref:GrpB family protein n=1 Tax=Enterococcus sp. TaxID=35783 RepID=UPI00257C07D7|nr:GrpB family protein [Enterococcus sp.]MBR3046758.1 GrpB family protein [Enterococcus sp.]
MKIGLQRGTVIVEDHKTEWEEDAKQTIESLRKILQSVAIDIQHVGSTAIKNICAKPIIDIAVGVLNLDEMLSLNDVLEENGFIFRGQVIPDELLYVCGENDFRTHHIHITVYDSEEWNNYLNMRDYLNCHEEDAHAYSELKKRLAEQYPDDRGTYTSMKSEMITEILYKANLWRTQPDD